jgi:hypothetical protein
MSILRRSGYGFSSTPTGLQRNYWNLPSEITRNLSVLFGFFLPNCPDLPKTPAKGHKSRPNNPAAISGLQISQMQKCFLP